MFCSNCGTKVEGNPKFCCNCGNALNPVPKPEEPKSEAPKPEEPKPEASNQPEAKSDEFDVMISYCWKPDGNQQKMKQLRDKLVENNLLVWMDIDEMTGNMNDRMVEGVTKSKVIVACLSKEYQNSDNCRREYEYATRQKKPIVPVKVDKHRIEKWLDLLAGNIIYREVGSDEQMNQSLPDIMKDIKKNLGGKGISGADITVPEKPDVDEETDGVSELTQEHISELIDVLGINEVKRVYEKLGISHDDVQKGERAAESNDPDDKARSVFQLKWVQKQGPLASKKAIFEALKECKFMNSLQKLKQQKHWKM